MKINFDKSPLENLVSLILDANPGATLTNDQFTAQAPEAIADPVDGRNTSIKLVAVLGNGYSGNVTFTYHRLGLTEQVATPPTQLTVTEGCSEGAILNHFANVLGLIPDELKVVECVKPTIDSEDGRDTTDGHITIAANETSLLYQGDLTITLKAFIEPDMEDEFTNTELDGFEPDMDAPTAEDTEPAVPDDGPIGNIESVSFEPTEYDVVLEENETFKYKVSSVGEGGAALELDILIQNPQGGLRAKEQFNLYADSENPYGNSGADFEAQQVSATYADGVWAIDFGPLVTAALAASGEVRIYASILDINGKRLWGDMNNVTPDMLTKVNIEFAQPEGQEE